MSGSHDGLPRMPRLRYHTGPMDKKALSSKPPGVLILEIQRTLEELGMEVTRDDESEFRLTVVRPRYDSPSINLESITTAASTGSIGSDHESGHEKNDSGHEAKSGLFALLANNRRTSVADETLGRPSTDSSRSRSASRKSSGRRKLGVILSSLPMSIVRRISVLARYGRTANKGYDGSEQPPVASSSDSISIDEKNRNSFAWNRPIPPPQQRHVSLYEDDRGAEVRYFVEIHKIKNLKGIYIVDFKRIKGDIWAFKRIYQEVLPKLPIGGILT
ncbi:hypothetical protein HK098_004013 [Nowakowskiella sp. JEL0407]|nr:hypothetical protein HK098_004013 [Nowakowskiella sp. JEL0407]